MCAVHFGCEDTGTKVLLSSYAGLACHPSLDNLSNAIPFRRRELSVQFESLWISLDKGVKLIFTGGHIGLTVAFKGPNVILGLYNVTTP